MPSLHALILPVLGLGLITLFQLSSAAAIPAAAEICKSATPTLPVNRGATELPAPASNLTLSKVALGRGIQNYTCATSTAVPVQLGAVATLFDATAFVYANEAIFNTIPPIAVDMPLLLTGFEIPLAGDFPVLGHHYFDSAGTPVFNLSSVDEILFGKKTADIKAPKDASVGPDGTGAVDWLQLQDKGGSIGCKEVYRVVTAGGAAPAVCTSTDLISIQYAAEYWFFN